METNEKEVYQKKMEAQLNELNAKINELKATGEKAVEKIRAELNEKIEALRPKQETAQKKLKELKKASGEAWEDLKAGMEKAWEELKGAWDLIMLKYKQDYQKMVEAKLAEFGIHINELRAKSEKIGMELKDELNKRIDDLLKKKEVAEKYLEELKSVGTEVWKDIKPKIDAAVEALEKAYQQARSRF